MYSNRAFSIVVMAEIAVPPLFVLGARSKRADRSSNQIKSKHGEIYQQSGSAFANVDLSRRVIPLVIFW
jgi:hypothetical protein